MSIKNIFFLFLLFKFCICNGQIEDTPICFQDMNIPPVRYSESISLAKKLLSNGIVETSKRDSVDWHKIVIRVADKNEVARIPFNFQTYETIKYWDTTLVQEPKSSFKLINYLYDLAFSNSIKCYSFDGTKQYVKNDLIALIKSRDSVNVVHSHKKIVRYNEILVYQAPEVTIIEEWWQTTKGIQSRLLAVAPLLPRYDENDDYAGITLMCWFIL